MIRFIFAILFVVIFLLFSIITIPIGFIIRIFSKKAHRRYSRVMIRFAFRGVIMFAGTKTNYIGKENLIKDEPVLYIMNHRSIFDIMLTYVVFPDCTGYVAKKEMGKIPVFVWWMKLICCRFMDRKDLRAGMETIKDCANLVKDGVSVAICPEGTRNKTEEPMLEFHKGSFKIAELSGCKIVPVVFNNTENIFESHFPKLKKTKVTVEFLPAIDVKSLSRDEKKALSDNVRNDMIEAYNKNSVIGLV